MKKWNLIVDVAECTNCKNCFIACKDEYVDNEIEGYSAPQPLHGHKWINIVKKERGRYPLVDVAYVPTMCNHCDDAPCVEQGGGAVSKRQDGIVIIDPVKAKGNRALVDSCPYGAIWWNDEHQVPQAWPFDAHLLDQGWEHPRCVQSCPTGALKACKVSDEEMAIVVREDNLQTLHPDYATKPRVYYKNLERFTKLFVAGEVLIKSENSLDCSSGATVRLLANTNQVAVTKTDDFGEFMLDGLEPNSGEFQLEVTADGMRKQTVDLVMLDQCIALESIVLQAGA
ncbi:MAG: oxidoreductase [Proteobacteria bacterium]|nr:oxidoreductase [Pseudomonadota bacterium]